MRDTDLIELIKARPEKGLDILMNNYMGLVSSVVRSKLNNVCSDEDVEECVSDVFVDFYKSVGGFDPSRGTIKALICTMAKNKATSAYRSKISAPPPLSLDDEAFENTVPSGANVENEMIDAENRREIIEAISKLDGRDREIIFRKYYFCESSKQIAKKMKMTVSAVDTRTHRALAKLKDKLGDLI